MAWISVKVLGFDAFCFGKKFLVANLTDRNLKVKYRRSFFGFFWTILAPIAMSFIYYFVFKVFLKISREHYLPFIISGVMPWGFFASSLGEMTESLVSNQSLITKIPVPLHVFPYVTALTNFITLVFAVPVILMAALVSGLALTWNALWIFYFFFLLLIVTYCLGTILSILFVFFRDLKHAIGLVLQIWFYATPVVYGSDTIPATYKWILTINPVASIFEGIHASLNGGVTPSSQIFLVSGAWVLFLIVLLRVVHGRYIKGLAEYL